jgi:predicted DNA-binding transcriptional regulator AlpA
LLAEIRIAARAKTLGITESDIYRLIAESRAEQRGH